MVTSVEKVLRISFFENIYYSFWYYLKKVLPEKDTNPSVPAAVLSLVCKCINVLFAISFISWIIKVNIFKAFLEAVNPDIALFIFIVTALVVIYIDDMLFLKRFHAIKYKYKYLSDNDNKKHLTYFVVYLIATVISAISIPFLL